MIAEIELSYRSKLKNKEQLEILRKYKPNAELKDEPDANGCFEIKDNYEKLIVPIHDFVNDLPNLRFEFIRAIPSSSTSELLDKMNSIDTVFASIISKLDEINNVDIMLNQKCNVHLHGIGLLEVNHVKLLEDSCTDVLENHLDDGWRILSVCPQPDQRRPDYVLCRTKKE